MGFWVMAEGIIEIVSSIEYKRIGIPTWWLTLILGILGIIFGLLLVGNFGLSAAYMVILIATYCFMAGIVLITLFFSLNNVDSSQL